MGLDCHIQKEYSKFKLHIHLSSKTNRLGLIGPSGSGKTTLVHCLGGFVRPDQGSIQIDGQMLYQHDLKINLAPEKRELAVVFQQPALFPHLNVKKNLFFGISRQKGKFSITQIWEMIHILKLQDKLDQKVTSLSGGEQQRVAIGRALLSAPRLLIMDEPVNALDENLKFKILSYMKTLCTRFNIPYLFISHAAEEVRFMTEEVVIIEQGKVVQQKSTVQWDKERQQANTANLIEQQSEQTTEWLEQFQKFESTISQLHFN